jgi:ligand-binding sensor protein
MKLTDILSKEAWEHFEKSLFDRFQMNCSVYDASGSALTGAPHWCNRLCPQIKANKESLAAICAPGNQYFMAQVRQTRQPLIDCCDAGLIKIAVPIFVDEMFLGTAGGCGRLPVGRAVETFLLEKTMGLSKPRILRLCEDVTSMTAKEAGDLAVFVERQIAHIVDQFQKEG